MYWYSFCTSGVVVDQVDLGATHLMFQSGMCDFLVNMYRLFHESYTPYFVDEIIDISYIPHPLTV